MPIQGDFKAFLSDIEPSKSTVERIATAHNALRSHLASHDSFKRYCIGTYLSGSYAKCTSIRPVKDDDLRDVDVVVETAFSKADSPRFVLEALRDAIQESRYYSSVRIQSHSVGVLQSDLKIDVVPLVEDGGRWYSGCVDDGSWTETNPRGHLEWSTNVNKKHNGLYKPVVKIMKWWRREHCPGSEKWPGGIALEAIIANVFPVGAEKFEEAVIGVIEAAEEQMGSLVNEGILPVVADPVLPSNNLAKGLSFEDFRGFVYGLRRSLDILREEGSCNSAWRAILGIRFPQASQQTCDTEIMQIYSIEEALKVPHRQDSPWPFTKQKPGVVVVADVEYPDGHTERITSNGSVIPKNCTIHYRAMRAPGLMSMMTRWQVVNTGKEAYSSNCPRGGFESPNLSNGGRRETTAYAGRHYVQCLIIKNGKCVAHSKEFFIIVE